MRIAICLGCALAVFLKLSLSQAWTHGADYESVSYSNATFDPTFTHFLLLDFPEVELYEQYSEISSFISLSEPACSWYEPDPPIPWYDVDDDFYGWYVYPLSLRNAMVITMTSGPACSSMLGWYVFRSLSPIALECTIRPNATGRVCMAS